MRHCTSHMRAFVPAIVKFQIHGIMSRAKSISDCYPCMPQLYKTPTRSLSREKASVNRRDQMKHTVKKAHCEAKFMTNCTSPFLYGCDKSAACMRLTHVEYFLFDETTPLQYSEIIQRTKAASRVHVAGYKVLWRKKISGSTPQESTRRGNCGERQN